jgi:hypothetical protein
VPDYPSRSTRSGLRRDGEGGGREVLLIIDDAEYHPVAFSHTALAAAPNAYNWKEAMNREMDNLRSHNVYELVPRTLHLGRAFPRKLDNDISIRTWPDWLPGEITSALVSITAIRSCPSSRVTSHSPRSGRHSRPRCHPV